MLVGPLVKIKSYRMMLSSLVVLPSNSLVQKRQQTWHERAITPPGRAGRKAAPDKCLGLFVRRPERTRTVHGQSHMICGNVISQVIEGLAQFRPRLNAEITAKGNALADLIATIHNMLTSKILTPQAPAHKPRATHQIPVTIRRTLALYTPCCY